MLFPQIDQMQNQPQKSPQQHQKHWNYDAINLDIFKYWIFLVIKISKISIEKITEDTILIYT